MKDNIKFNEDEVDLKLLLQILWSGRTNILLITSIFAIFSVVFALSLPNTYTSSALLAPAKSDSSLNSSMGQLSSIARMGGINLPTNSESSKTNEAVERIKSFEFFSKYFFPNVLLENIVAVDRWDPNNEVIKYKRKIYDQSNGQWKKDIYTKQKAYEFYLKALSVNKDIATSFVKISIEHKSPIIAKKWLDIIIYNINESMRLNDINLSKSYIDFLSSSQKDTNIQSLKAISSSLMESQMQTLMLASSSQSYIFKSINSPIVPELKSGPKRSIICIAITIFGGILSMLFVTARYFYRDR